jgi:twitching motility protein PilT
MADVDINKLLYNVLKNGASDLHLIAGAVPKVRIDGRLIGLKINALSAEEIETLAYSLLNDKQRREFEEFSELDFAVQIPNIGRFRANYYRTLGSVACAFRIINNTILTLDDLDAKAIFKELIKREKGLILVTGPTGSGKSTTLAAMIHEINRTQNKHIITIEDPVEYIHTNDKSLFSHRNVGTDTKSFARALKASLREDPDIILIGEMRDKETISAAITAAETGHLVFGTLHTNSAPQTINRIIDTFSGDEQGQIRAQLSTSIVAVVAQALLPKIGGGRVGVYEIMIANSAIQNLIREDKVHQLYSQMQLNQTETGMTTQTQELIQYLKDGDIERDEAIRYCNRKDELLRNLESL